MARVPEGVYQLSSSSALWFGDVNGFYHIWERQPTESFKINYHPQNPQRFQLKFGFNGPGGLGAVDV